MTNTTYFHLKKPAYADPIDVKDFTNNFDIIDTALMASRAEKTQLTNSINKDVVSPCYYIINDNEFDVTVTDRNFSGITYTIEAGHQKRFDLQHATGNMNYLVSDLHEVTFKWYELKGGSGGGSGTTDYDDLSNKPSINGTTLSGNKTLADIGILNSEGKIKSDLLPAFVDNYDSYANRAAFPTTGVEDRLYLAQDTRLSYVWDTATSDYVVVGSPLALGEAEGTAYRGDRGKIAYEHSQATHARTDATAVSIPANKNGYININGTDNLVYEHPKATGSSDTNPHGTTASDVGLGNALVYSQQVLSLEQKTQARANIGAGTSSFSGSYSDLSNIPSEFTPASHTHETYENNISSLDSRVSNLENRSSKIYGFHINSNESNPSNAVTYLADAVGMTPAYMDYTSGKFNYGSWKDAFFMPRPCMLNADGTVAYYLNPNDYTKKVDGTTSDIAVTTHSMNAMMEWGTGGKKIWVKKVADADDPYSVSVYISDEQVDTDYHAWSFIGTDGTLKEHFYTPIYHGSEISGKLRSLSGQVPIMNKTAKSEIDLATANGSGWFTEVLCDIDLINDLLVLISKTLDSQNAFGMGNSSGYKDNPSINYGMLNSGSEANAKGLFWGSNVSNSSTTHTVKVFGMENWWGNQFRRFAGMVLDGSNGIKIKKCYGTSDGSSVQIYNIPTDDSSGVTNGYISTGIIPTGSTGSRISKINYSAGMSVPNVINGSDTTYYCDGFWYNNQVNYAIRNGDCSHLLRCGEFSLCLNVPPSFLEWNVGASLSYKGGN